MEACRGGKKDELIQELLDSTAAKRCPKELASVKGAR
jgi:hypothetical protein